MKVKHENPTRLKLWIDSARFFKNDEQLTDLNPMPTTTKSPPLPSELEGNTYMPVRAILEALGADIEWINSERRVDVKLGDITLQL
ncbi:MAG: stalk domain-containing protein [Caldisericia bacterium]